VRNNITSFFNSNTIFNVKSKTGLSFEEVVIEEGECFDD